MTERTELEIECMSKEENYICGYNDGVADTHEQYMLIPIAQGMTNGDVIKAMFPNGKVIETEDGDLGYEIYIDKDYSFCSWFDGLWWNAPYKESE